MRRVYNYDDNRGIWLSILMIIIGLVLVMWPGHVMTTAIRVLGFALLAGGGILIYSWNRDRAIANDPLTLAEGIVLAVAGLFVLLAPGLIISIIPFAVGGVVVVNGILNLAQALDQKRYGYYRWTWALALAILTIVLGGLIILNPFSTMEMLVIAIGVIIIYNGVSNLLIEFGYHRMNR